MEKKYRILKIEDGENVAYKAQYKVFNLFWITLKVIEYEYDWTNRIKTFPTIKECEELIDDHKASKRKRNVKISIVKTL